MLDTFPTKLLMSHLYSILDIILCIGNLCFSSGVFPTSCKSSISFPLIKKLGLDPEIFKNYRSVKPIIHFENYCKSYCKPKNLDLRNGWKRKIPRDNLVVIQNSKVCMKHFEEQDLCKKTMISRV